MQRFYVSVSRSDISNRHAGRTIEEALTGAKIRVSDRVDLWLVYAEDEEEAELLCDIYGKKIYDNLRRTA